MVEYDCVIAPASLPGDDLHTEILTEIQFCEDLVKVPSFTILAARNHFQPLIGS